MSVSLWLRTSFFVVWVVRGESGINPVELTGFGDWRGKSGISPVKMTQLGDWRGKSGINPIKMTELGD